MRIRKSASRLLGSPYSTSAALPVGAMPSFNLLPPPLPHPVLCSAPESGSGPSFSSPSASSAEPCVLNRSAWDFIAELSLSDQKEEDELVDKYFVHVTAWSSWLFPPTMSSTSTKNKKLFAAAYGDSKRLRREVVKRAAMDKEEGKTKKKAKAKKEKGQNGAARVWMCKKNDGRRWRCNRPVSQPNTLCEYHLMQKRSYLNPDFESPSMAELEEAARASVQAAAASKPSTSNKQRNNKKKKPRNDCSATEGFYYYAGFGPFRTKRHCRSGGMNGPLPARQQEQESPEDASHPTDKAPEIAELTNQDQDNGDDEMAGIAGVDEESSDDDYDDGIGIPGRNMDGTADPQASTGEGKRKAPWKRWRKPMKARSLKSLM